MAPAVVGKRQTVKIELSHQEAGNACENKGPAAQRQHALSESGRHDKSEPDGSPPHATKFVEEVEVRVRVPRDVFFHQGHTHVQAAHTVRIVSRLDDAHQVIVHDQGRGFQTASMLAEWKLHHVLPLKSEHRSARMGSVHASEGVGEGSGSAVGSHGGGPIARWGFLPFRLGFRLGRAGFFQIGRVHGVVDLVGFTVVVAPPVGRPRLRLVLVHGESSPHIH